MNWWQKRQSVDQFVKMRTESGLISRSYFKIKAIDERFKICKQGSSVLDLGAAPGGWTQYFLKRQMKTMAVDILDLKIPIISEITFMKRNIFENFLSSGESFSLFCSDLCPNISGNSSIDQSKFITIFDRLLFLLRHLCFMGNFVVKTFDGYLRDYVSANFNFFIESHFFKPIASRKESSEIYFVGLGYRLKSG